jgi:hypothetical protein
MRQCQGILCRRPVQRAAASRNQHGSTAELAGTQSLQSQVGLLGNCGMSLMWMPPHTTVPPLRTARSARGTSDPTGAKMIAASNSSGADCWLSPATRPQLTRKLLCCGVTLASER